MCDTLFSSWLAIKGDVPQSSTLGHDHLLLMTYAYCRSLFQFADDSYLFVQLETETENGNRNGSKFMYIRIQPPHYKDHFFTKTTPVQKTIVITTN